LDDALRDPIGMLLLVLCMLEEFALHTFGAQALRHEVMPFIAPRADHFGGQRVVEEPEHDRSFRFIAGRHGAVFDLTPRAIANHLHIEHKLLLLHVCLLVWTLFLCVLELSRISWNREGIAPHTRPVASAPWTRHCD